jgi:hypothetical protein
MPTRKQRRREAKAKRHDYEFVYLDDEGNEVEPPPEDVDAPRPRASTNGSKSVAKKPAQSARGRRTPQPPSWQRAARRALVLGAVVFVLFSLGNRKHGSYASAAGLAVLYTVLFIPFTYMIDRFAYKRFQAREQAGGSSKQQAKKR